MSQKDVHMSPFTTDYLGEYISLCLNKIKVKIKTTLCCSSYEDWLPQYGIFFMSDWNQLFMTIFS